MKSFTYTIVDPVGIHARPAGALVRYSTSHTGFSAVWGYCSPDRSG